METLKEGYDRERLAEWKKRKHSNMAVKVRHNADRILHFRRVGVKIKDKAGLRSVSDSMKELQLRILNF